MQNAECFTTPTNVKSANKPRTITLSCVNIPEKGETTRVLFLNNTEVKYIPDTGAAILVISEETAKRAGLNVHPYDKNKVRVMTADGKEVQDVPGYVESDVTLGEHQLKGVKMLVFKRATNPCLIGRDVLAVNPSTKDHYQAMMGVTKPKAPNTLPLKHNHNVNNNTEEADNSSIECKINENRNRLPYKTKIENSIERRCATKSSIESTYDCGRDHQCPANAQQINVIDYPKIPVASPPEEIILIRAIDVVVEEINQALNDSVFEHEKNTPNQSTCFATPESQKSYSEPYKQRKHKLINGQIKNKSKKAANPQN